MEEKGKKGEEDLGILMSTIMIDKDRVAPPHLQKKIRTCGGKSGFDAPATRYFREPEPGGAEGALGYSFFNLFSWSSI